DRGQTPAHGLMTLHPRRRRDSANTRSEGWPEGAVASAVGIRHWPAKIDPFGPAGCPNQLEALADEARLRDGPERRDVHDSACEALDSSTLAHHPDGSRRARRDAADPGDVGIGRRPDRHGS